MRSNKSTDSKKFLSLVQLCLLVSFLILGFLASQFPYFKLDLEISRALQSFHQPYFSFLMNFVSELGDDFHLELIVAAAVALLFLAGYKLEAFKAAVFAGFTALLGTVLKLLVNRPRPTEPLVNIQEILLDKSFPSLHVLIFTAFFGYLFYLSLYKIKTGWLKLAIALGSVFLILSIGLSRVYLGAHWPSDVLGAYLLGLFLISYIITHGQR